MAVYFFSDLHLGAPYFADSKEAERHVVSFLDEIKDDAETVYLLGDVLDYWYEYRYVVPRGFVRFFGKLAELVDSGVRVVWMIGNHDIWIFDYLPSEIGVEVVDGTLVEEIYGHKILMSHGDGVGKLPKSFRILRSFFRNKTCQRLFSAIHPRWTVPFAYNWSRHSRKKGEARGIPEQHLLDNLRNFSNEYRIQHPDVDFFIYGHVHVLDQEKLSAGGEMIVLGEWIHTFSYAKFTENGHELRKWTRK